MSVVDIAAKDLLQKIGKGEFEKRKITRLYCKRKMVSEAEEGDPEINKLAKLNNHKAGVKAILKSDYTWRTGYGENPMTESKDKVSKKDFNWKEPEILRGGK